MKKFTFRRLGVAQDTGTAKPTLHSCLEAVLDQSDTLVDDVLAGLEGSLSPVKGKTLHAVQNPAINVAIENLRADRGAVRKTFAVALRAAVYGGEGFLSRAQPLVRFDDFQFLEAEQIDANIESALAQQEILLAVDDVLPAVDALISSLLGWVTVQAHLNPLKPESFVHALRESLAAHVPMEAARAAVLTPASGLLGVSLRQLYKEIADWLRSQGVEPAGPVGVPGGEFAMRGQAPESPVNRTMLTLDKLRRLLSGELATVAQAGGKDFNHTVPASFVALEDMRLVEPMMKRLADRANQLADTGTAGSLSRPVDEGAAQEQSTSKRLGRQLGEEVVRLMLENLMKDRRLLAPVRTSLKNMESVLIKLSQADVRFFSDRQHPARQFLDKITHRSLAFSSESEPGFEHFRASFDASVGAILAGDGDAVGFADALAKLESGWLAEEGAQRQRAEDAARGLLHAEQRNLLAQRLAIDFGERLQKKTIPGMVAAFLRGPWAQVVAESQLKCVDGTADADGYLGLVDDLIWSVRLRLIRHNRARLVQMVPGMLVKMRQGLQLISYPEDKVAEFFNALITVHEKAFDLARTATEDGASSAPGRSPGDVAGGIDAPPGGVWMVEEEAADSGYLQDTEGMSLDFTGASDQADQSEAIDSQSWSTGTLNTGSWVDLGLGGQWVRAQLTWTSPHRTLFMFISGGGMAHSMSLRTLDRLHGLGLIRLVSDGRVMDNALDAVARAALQNDMKKAGEGS